MFGFDPEGTPPNFAEQTALYGTDSLQELRAAIEVARSTGAPYDLEIEFFRSDSSRGWMRSWGEAVRRVVGHEALVRWEHPARGLLTPYHFLPTAEDSGLIIDVGQQVLDQVCTLLASSPDPPGMISVNFSPVQLARAGWLQAFVDTLTRHEVDPRRIVVEVAETAVMSLLPGTHDDLLALRDLGIGLHVDDFGTGFSSISLLRDMPVTGLKLDASFVADVGEVDDAANALSAGLAGLVNGLHLTGIAEGVETEDQHRVLSAHGWSHAQGYLYGRPEPRPVLTVTEQAGPVSEQHRESRVPPSAQSCR